MTAKPCALLTLMNASTENYIADAAEKAVKLLATNCETVYSSMPTPQRFDFICVLGPVEDAALARTITHQWIRSRGGFPRTTRAQILAQHYGIGFVPNAEAIYALGNNNVSVKILSSSSSGSTLEITPKKTS